MVWPLSLLWSSNSNSNNDDVQTRGEASNFAVAPEAKRSSSSSNPIDLLHHFESPGMSLPPSARVGDPKLKQRQGQPLSIWQLGKMGTFAAMKAIEMATDVVYHHVRGPRRVSWGIEMTLLSSIMRDVGRHSHLGDMALIRMLMGIGGWIPLPSDALATPVTFRVRRRNLPGILTEFDAAEDGTRELSGEWVVGKRTWQRLQKEWRAAKQQANSPNGGSAGGTSPQLNMSQHQARERVILYLHGGAYYVSSAASHRLITIPLAKHLDARVFAIDYRLAPETRFPGPLHDVVSAYLRLVEDLHIPPENIIVAGDSAGGGLSLALIMYLRDNEFPLPSAAILMSPWVDLTMSCESWDSNAEFDIVPRPMPGDHLNPIACYLGEHMEKYLTHPYASPLFGDFKGLPPMLIQAGECEVLRDEIMLLAHKATLAGVEVRHEQYEDAVHVFQTLPFLDTAQKAFISSRDFVQNFLPQWQRQSPQALQGSTERGLEQEIDNDSARVVRGDGMETGSRREDIGSASDEERECSRRNTPESDQSVSASSSTEGDRSWASSWSPPPSSEEDNSGPSTPTEYATVAVSPVHDRPRMQSRPSLRRLKSTFSFIADASYRSATSHLDRAPLHPDISGYDVSDEGVLHIPRWRRSTLSTSPQTAPLMPPSIRRSEASHPDISSLVQQFSASGPANQTITYKPDDSRRRRRARTLSGKNNNHL
ncbi:hypothetical protein POSPLADRAFT_1175785 [Postia placenta MAD-698-R-SB12]|uniref:Alpha/beta hydrolase fold-3 domain-containing protein n=1 Tax=Postia placenta MAD-698-R-SB12 TaxID=670580 RepID=A0A1X6NEI7_9APHY|nr:hypothetical protein POSPLADRAFT_1175785 [Postia placenta MAD-698-R-SB12]OSX67049.1 hypothetical protein POSPLADRAFT_1175785 [Postia placenta MAD-698-R-SB12]